MTTSVRLRWALLLLPHEYRQLHGDEVLATLGELAEHGQMSTWRETSDLVLLGLRLRARIATENGQRSWRAGLHSGGMACLLSGMAVAALRLGAAVKSLGDPFRSALAFLPTGGWHLAVELFVLMTSLLLILRPSRLPRILYATAVLASLGAVWWLPATDRAAGFGFASFGVVAVLLTSTNETIRPRRAAAAAATSGSTALFAFSTVMHGGNGGVGVVPGIGSSDLLVRLLPFAALVLLASIPIAAVDARPVVACAVVTIPLCATLFGTLLLGRDRFLERGHWQALADGRSQIPTRVLAFEGRLHQGIAITLAVGLLLLLVATTSVTHHHRTASSKVTGEAS